MWQVRFLLSLPWNIPRRSLLVNTPDYRSLPSVDKLLKHATCARLIKDHGRALVTFALREAVDRARARIRSGRTVLSEEALVMDAANQVRSLTHASLVPVINATGIILHTNLGRAPLGTRVIEDIARAAGGYTNLEFDLKTARRGHRNVHVAALVRYLTGAQDALVVNNNAAGLVLALNTLAKRRETIISRGELIEIGGAFRIPDIMRAAGTKMVEVGTTNRTRLSDYEKALSSKTALVVKAHQSNYSITGFAQDVPLKELARFAHEHDLPVLYDIGSGLLRKPHGLPLDREPDVRGAIADGADLVAFSCDKLLGGPQAGIVAGRSDLVRTLARAPLMRALRVGKLTLAALAGACRRYLSDPDLINGNPTFAMLNQTADTVRLRAEALRAALAREGIAAAVVDSTAQAGGGSLPELELRSFAVQVNPPAGSAKHKERFAERLFRGLLDADPPVLAILREGKVLFDVFTVGADELETVADRMKKVISAGL
ncbi:MAG: L-seryl-tRNA(Sec) selenium transferase [Chitinivibrionales bacterium]|nr:L-seryl-tRNA(Sec) selenium transferase [Chitinivibrionales bacterium]MBD3395690.1 L-seryl-tRNA(Sec) selenium transferase [Chitinivibrionales bacterium]